MVSVQAQEPGAVLDQAVVGSPNGTKPQVFSSTRRFERIRSFLQGLGFLCFDNNTRECLRILDNACQTSSLLVMLFSCTVTFSSRINAQQLEISELYSWRPTLYDITLLMRCFLFFFAQPPVQVLQLPRAYSAYLEAR